MLRTETNTPEVEEAVRAAFATNADVHQRTSEDFEHGQWWVSCLDCGAQWGACDLNEDDFCFEQVTLGDGSCEEAAR